MPPTRPVIPGRGLYATTAVGSAPQRTSGKPEQPLAPGTRIVERDEEPPADHDDSDTERGLRPGDHVRHRRYGRGVVMSVEGGPAPVVVARFGPHGSRRILASYLERS